MARKRRLIRRVQASTMYDPAHLEFLERKINKNLPRLENRSSIVGLLIEKAMEDPRLLEA